MRLRHDDQRALIPGLKDSLALQCLARIPRADHAALRRVSTKWRSALLSKQLYVLRQQLGVAESWIYLPFFSTQPSSVSNRSCSSISSWIEAYDPRQNAWHRISGIIPGVADSEFLKGFAFVAMEERLFVIGGRLCTKERELGVRSEVYALNCITGKWSQCSSMSTPRVDFACTVCNGCIYVAGGLSDLWQEKGVASAERFDPETDSWIPLPSMNIRRYKCVGITWDAKFYVVGGFSWPEDPNTSPVYTLDRSSVDVFDPATGAWELRRGMWQLDVPPNQIIPVQGRLYSSGDVLNTWKGRVEMYDAGLNMWKIVGGSQRMQPIAGEHNRQPCYLTIAPVGKSSLLFIGGYKPVQNATMGYYYGDDGDDDGDDDDECILEAVSVFDTSSGAWGSMEPVTNRCKELCSHCCTVAV